MAPLSEENKSKLLARLKEGRERIKKARADAKEKGLPDPKPRKARKSKAVIDPASAPAANEKIAPIDSAPRNAVNEVAAKPVDPSVSKSKPIDVPNLPGEGKQIVKNAEAVPEVKSNKVAEKYEDNQVLRSEETGNQAIEVNYPGQKESIKKLLDGNKKDKPLAPAANPDPPNQTVKRVKMHVPDIKAVEGRAPFSFSAIRKALYQ